MGRRRLLVVVSATIAAVILAAAVTLDLLGRDGESAAPPVAATSVPSPTGAATSTGPTDEATGSAGAASAVPTSSPSAPASDAAVPSAPTVATPDPERPLEVTAPEPEATGLPPSAALPALVRLPLPPSASTDGSVVSGFPTSVVPIPDAARVTTSSVASDGSVLRAGLTADGTATADSIVESYRAVLSPLGFTSTELPGNDGGAAVGFVRGADSVSLSIDPAREGRTAYSVFAVLNAE